MRTMTIVEFERALPRLEWLLAQSRRVLVTRRGKVIAECEATGTKSPRPLPIVSRNPRGIQAERKRPPIKGTFVR